MHLVAAAQLQRLRVAEQQRAEGGAERHPVAEDHRGETDVPAPAGLALLEAVGGDHREEAAAEAGEGAGDEHRDRLVEVDVDAERLGGLRRLTAEAQTQTERRAPQHVRCRRDEQDGDERQPRHVRQQAAEDAGEVGDEEPVLALEIRQH